VSGRVAQTHRPDPRLGSWTDLDHARAQLHARGLGLLLDFVPNHTALDHPWVRTHPDFYLQGTKGDYEREPAAFFMVRSARGGPRYLARGRDPFFPPWTDTAQLNHFHPPTRAALGREIQTIAAHCDGLRCDMAMLVLNDIFARTWDQQLRGCERPATEFWPEVTAAAPRLLWLAEAYWNLEWQLQQLGFHFTYDKRLYDRLRHAPREVYLHLKADWDYQKGLARFLENHDEPRAAVVFGRERFEAVATLVGTLPGMRFFHQGQLEGRRHHLPVQLARAGPEPPDPLIRSFYERLLPISHAEVFHRGEWCLLQRRPAGDSTFEGLIPYRWRSKSAYKLVVANLAGYTAQGIVPLEGEIEPGRDYDFYDQLNDVHYERGGEDLVRHGLFVRLEAHRAHLFDVRPR